MKFSFTTYALGQGKRWEELLPLAKKAGCAGLEFRTGGGHKHGVEVSLSTEERKAVRRAFEDQYMEVSCLNSPHYLDSPDPAIRRAQIEGAKETCKLAADLGCGRIRLFGDSGESALDAQARVELVAEGLREIADFAAPLKVDALLEMHGFFNFWGYALSAVEKADHSNAMILYNCDNRDLVGGSMRETFARVRKYVRHIHTHELDVYPYLQLFEEAHKMGYEGYFSAEIPDTTDPDYVLPLYITAMKALRDLASYTVAR